jgi:hypothetical protein
MARKIPFIFLFFSIVLPIHNSFTATINVPYDYPTIQMAIDAASDGDIILVDDGFYAEEPYTIDFLGKAITVKSINGPEYTIIGAIHCHNRESSSTVLDGFRVSPPYLNQSQYSMITQRSSPTIKNCIFEINEWYNPYGIVCNDHSSPYIESCTFRNIYSGKGLGILCNHGARPIIESCTFENLNSSQGGAITCRNSSSLKSYKSDFINCSTGWGGAIRFASGIYLIINDCDFTNCSAAYGGAISFDVGESLTIDNCNFSGNTAREGGAIWIVNSQSANISGCVFRSNRTNSDYPWGGAIEIANSDNVSLLDCIFLKNSAYSEGDLACGGAVDIANTAVFMSHCEFDSNFVQSDIGYAYGGALSAWVSSSLTITNCRMTHNWAESPNNISHGGALFIARTPFTINESIIANNRSLEAAALITTGEYQESLISNCTISHNIADISGSLILTRGMDLNIQNCNITYNSDSEELLKIVDMPTDEDNELIQLRIAQMESAGSMPQKSSPYITQNINHFSEDKNLDKTTLSFQCTNLFGNSNGDWVGNLADYNGINGNFSANPLFCNPPMGDYHIINLSPCSPPNNSCGQLIGALGVGCQIPFACGDANLDDVVSLADIYHLISYYFNGGEEPSLFIAADVNCDLRIDLVDMVFLNSYLFHSGVVQCCQ